MVPNFLYKFRGVEEKIGDKIIPLYTLKKLFEGYIYFSSYAQLNDPYEIWPCYKKLKPGEITQQKLNYIINKYGRKGNEEELIDFLKKPIMPEDIKPIRDGFSKYKYFCLSGTYKEPLLWAHYSEGCRGYAIIFDSKKLYKSVANQYNAMHMDVLKYEEERPISYLFEEDFDYVAEMKDKLFRKYHRWGYEEECRIVIESDSNELEGIEVAINKECIQGIILGPRATSYHDEIKEMCRIHKIQTYPTWINNEDNEFIIRSVLSI